MGEKLHYLWKREDLKRWLEGEMPITRHELRLMRKTMAFGGNEERLKLVRYRILAMEIEKAPLSPGEEMVLNSYENKKVGMRKIFNRRSDVLNARMNEEEEIKNPPVGAGGF